MDEWMDGWMDGWMTVPVACPPVLAKAFQAGLAAQPGSSPHDMPLVSASACPETKQEYALASLQQQTPAAAWVGVPMLLLPAQGLETPWYLLGADCAADNYEETGSQVAD